MTEKIAPALTPDEWDRVRTELERDGYGPAGRSLEIIRASSDFDTQHADAALALHGQPYGFTWADVDDVRRCVLGLAVGPDRAAGFRDQRLLALADRIAALLPPRENRPAYAAHDEADDTDDGA